jgi:hypothetical protein
MVPREGLIKQDEKRETSHKNIKNRANQRKSLRKTYLEFFPKEATPAARIP